MLEQRRRDLVGLEHSTRTGLAARLVARRRAQEAHASRLEQRAVRLHRRIRPHRLIHRRREHDRRRRREAQRRQQIAAQARRPSVPMKCAVPARRRRRRPSARARCDPSQPRRPDPTDRRERAGRTRPETSAGRRTRARRAIITTWTSQPRSTSRRTSSGLLYAAMPPVTPSNTRGAGARSVLAMGSLRGRAYSRFCARCHWLFELFLCLRGLIACAARPRRREDGDPSRRGDAR